MKQRALGKSTIKISELSLGCMSLPTNLQEARTVVEAAIDFGMNYFDTADLYDKGLNEEIVGEILKPHRSDLILATKVGNRWDDSGNGWHWDPSPAHIENGLKKSLKRLKTDYIDVYQLHGGTSDDPWDDIIDTFERLKKEGLIREYGISSIRPNVFMPFLQNSQAISNMMQFSILDRRPEEWFEQIGKTHASIVTRGSLAKGLLTNDWKSRVSSSPNYMNYSNEELIDVLSKLQNEYGDIHALALAFNLSFPVIASTVIGARTKEQLAQTIKAYENVQEITNFDFINEVTKRDLYMEHR